MADNYTFTPGTGATAATEDVGGAHYTKIKTIDPTPTSSTPIGTAANPHRMGGPIAHDSAASTNPVQTAGEARSSLPTPVQNGDVTRLMADLYGRQYAIVPKLTWASSNTTPITTATTTSIISAPSAGSHLRIYRLHATNSSATKVIVSWKATGGTELFHANLPENGTVSINLNGSHEVASATAFNLVTSAAGSVHWAVGYETLVD